MPNTSKPSITPKSGYLLCIPFIESGTFKAAKEEAGSVQKSTVIAIGKELIDDYGNARQAECKVNDVILHKYVSDEFTIDFDQYRMVHFADMRGVWNNPK